jgi:2-desacetyl-2-hydroxyethyl bacteriochlorophyllide A dehydrogenase
MTGIRLVVPAPREVRVEEYEVPEPGSAQVRVRTEVSLVSAGTELAIYTGIHQGLSNPNTTWPKFPQVMGYMAVGRVEACGEQVTAVRPGQRLLCSGQHATTSLIHGAVPGLSAWVLPEELLGEQAVFARMAKTAITAVARAGVTMGQSLAVLGLGIIGQIALRLFEGAGAFPILGIDPIAARRAAAERGGAVVTIDPGPPAPPILGGEREALDAGSPPALGGPGGAIAQRVREALGGRGADIVLDTTGWASAVPTAMSLAEDGGRVVLLGSPRGKADDVDFYSDLHRRSLHVIGAHDSGIGFQSRERFPWTNDRVLPYIVHSLRRGRFRVDDLITHCVRPERLQEMYEGLLHQKEEFLGVVLDWRE